MWTNLLLVPLTRRRREHLQQHHGAQPDAPAASRSRAGRHAVIMGSHYQKHEHRTSSSRSRRQRILIQQGEDDEFDADSSYRRRKDTARRQANTPNSHTAVDEKKRT
jgi:hypothetical protein